MALGHAPSVPTCLWFVGIKALIGSKGASSIFGSKEFASSIFGSKEFDPGLLTCPRSEQPPWRS
jgi:hypothetical protein